jgi:hypothetical protein
VARPGPLAAPPAAPAPALPVVHRQPAPPPAAGGGVVEFSQGAVYVMAWADDGLAIFSLAGAPWVTVRWTPDGKRTPKLGALESLSPEGWGAQASAPFDLRVTVDRAAEAAYASRRLGKTAFVHDYTAAGHKVTINEHLPGGAIVEGSGPMLDTKSYEGHELEIQDPELRPPRPAPPLKEPPPFWWEFDRESQLAKMAATYPRVYWIGLRVGDRLRAYGLDETNMQKAAEACREDPEVFASVTSVYEAGTAWASTDLLYERFYPYLVSAEIGAPGDAEECLIYRHGTSSFGRSPLTHKEALAEWRRLETRNAADVAAQKVDGLFPFHELRAAGRTAVWSIDLDYFELRDAFFANVAQRGAGAGEDWSKLFDHQLPVWEHYLRYALDRDEAEVDPQLTAVVDTDSDLVDAAGEKVFERVSQFARSTARSAVETALASVEIYLDDGDKLKGLVLQFPFMSAEERNQAMTLLGVPAPLSYVYAILLADAERAQMVAMGESPGMSLEVLRSFVEAHAKELRKVIEAIASGQADPLAMQGDFGDQVRKVTYEGFGFQLDPKRFPHEDEVAARESNHIRWSRALSTFGTEQGFLFAHETARRARHARHMKWLLIAIAVVAAVVLVIVSAGIGAAVAGLAFSAATTASAIAFGVTEVVVSAAVVTLVGPALNTFIMSGGSLDPELYRQAYSGLGWQFLVNVGTFGFFKLIGVGIRAAAVIGAGGEEAFQASRAWQGAATVGRIGISGGSMFAISVVSNRLQSGHWPKGETMTEIIFETGLSIVLLEIGGYLARGQMQRVADWAERQRIGGDVIDQMKQLRLDVHKLNMDTAAFGASPLGGKKVGLELLARQKSALQRQADLLEKLRGSFRTSPDAVALEKVLGPELADIHARIDAIRGVEAFAQADVQPAAAGGSGDVAEFTYKRGEEQALKDYYGEDKVQRVGDHLEVDFQGKKLVFRPATDTAAGMRPDGTRNPDALQAWRQTAALRMAKILERAGALAADDAVLRDVTGADPKAMDAEAMRAFEQKLARAEKLLDRLEKGGPSKDGSIERNDEATEAWRQRLADERDRVVRRADLLGLEGNADVKALKRLPMNRGGLKENTLQNYRDAIERVRKLVDGEQAAKQKALDTAKQGPPADVDAIRDRLKARRTEVLQRAEIYGAGGRKYVLAVEELGRRIPPTESLEKLAGFETTIAEAEARLDALAKKALADAEAVQGKDVLDFVRSGAGLEKLTDAQVGDVMRQLAKAGKLSPDVLRGALLAGSAAEAVARGRIPLEQVVEFARSPEEMDYVLDTFAKLRDAQVGGTFDLLRRAASSAGSWQGGVWQMELAREVIGIEKVRSFEVKEGLREVDIELHDGTHVEAKDWSEWRPDKVDKQFYQDLENNTHDGTDPSGLDKIRWLFRSPPPTSVARIRVTMARALERFIGDKVKAGLMTEAQADALRDAFGKALKLVEVPTIDRTQVVKPPIDWHPPLPPPRRRDDATANAP